MIWKLEVKNRDGGWTRFYGAGSEFFTEDEAKEILAFWRDGSSTDVRMVRVETVETVEVW